jgi:hypothetical protein
VTAFELSLVALAVIVAAAVLVDLVATRRERERGRQHVIARSERDERDTRAALYGRGDVLAIPRDPTLQIGTPSGAPTKGAADDAAHEDHPRRPADARRDARPGRRGARPVELAVVPPHVKAPRDATNVRGADHDRKDRSK